MRKRGPLPVIPLFAFAAIDLVLALLLLLAGGFSIQFWIVALIGMGLTLAGWIALRNPAPRE